MFVNNAQIDHRVREETNDDCKEGENTNRHNHRLRRFAKMDVF